MQTCSIEGCDRPQVAHGWCMKHYQRWSRHGDSTFTITMMDHPGRCAVDGCGRDYYATGYCKAHYSRVAAHGNLHADVPIGPAISGRLLYIEPMPCSTNDTYRAVVASMATATEASAARHLAAWWAMDARIQAANDAYDDARLAAD